MYEGNNFDELEIYFKEAVDEYIMDIKPSSQRVKSIS